MAQPLLTLDANGIYCPAGRFHIDPWRGVDRAVITHGHSDHARWGSRSYLSSNTSVPILKIRLGADANIEGVAFGEPRTINGVRVSLHPAGHLLGSAQVRVEHRGEVWVVTGDYKIEPDATCEPFEPIKCHGFVTECTFGLPIYRWRPQAEIFAAINAWWRQCRDEGRTAILYSYALGKAQRILAGLDPGIGPIMLHGAVERLMPAYRDQGISLPDTLPATADNAKAHKGKAIVIAPPSAGGSPWVRKFAPSSDAFASGWMAIRGTRRRRALDRGFVLSDHVDWDGLMQTIKATGAETIWATHGYTNVVARYLNEQGYDARAIETRFVGESTDSDPEDTAGTEENT